MANILYMSANADLLSGDHGGKQKALALVEGIAKKHKVTILALDWKGQSNEVQVSPQVKLITIAIDDPVRRAVRERNSGLLSGSSDLMIGIYNKYMRKYRVTMNKFAKTSAAIVLDHYSMAPFLNYLDTDTPVFYISQNAETDLAKQLYPKGAKDILVTHSMERTAIMKSSALGYCSDEDLEKIGKSFSIAVPTYHIPNGTYIPEGVKPGSNVNSKMLLFVGSGHPPNHVAVANIIKIAKQVPDYTFVIAGNASNSAKGGKVPKNVELLGYISHEEIDKLFSTARAFINPMESGSGTHLKTLKALSWGLPGLSSNVGARGLSDKEKSDTMIIADDLDSMVDAIRKLEDKTLYKKLSKNAYELSKKFSWERIQDDLLASLNNVIKGIKPEKKVSKREKVLVYSIIRNEEQYMDGYYDKLKLMVETFPEYEFYLSLYENDSTDATLKKLKEKDWSFFSKHSLISESLKTEAFGSVKNADRVKNLSIARNKAIEAKNFLKDADYVMMIESDMEFDMTAVRKILEFKDKEPDFDIVSGITIRGKGLYDAWATRKQAKFSGKGDLDDDYKLKAYDKYYSTSNGICLYRAEPFREGVRYGWINPITKEADCDTVVVCQDFHARGYSNIYIIHDAEIYHEHF